MAAGGQAGLGSHGEVQGPGTHWDNLRNTIDIEHVMKNGRLYDAATLTEVRPRRRPLPTQWWWRLEPPGAQDPQRR